MTDRLTFSMWVRKWIGDPATQIGFLSLIFLLMLLWSLINKTDLESYWRFRSNVSVVQGRVLNSQLCAHWCIIPIRRPGISRIFNHIVFAPPEMNIDDGDPDRRIYITEYTFNIPGNAHTYQDRSYSESKPLTRGQAVSVEYSNNHPSISRIAGQRRAIEPLPSRGLLVLTVFAVFGILFFWNGLNRSRRRSIFPNDPEYTTGRLRNPSGTSSITPKFKKLVQNCSFEFKTTNGHMHEVKSLSIKPKSEWLAYIIGCNPQWNVEQLFKGQVGFFTARAYKSALKRLKLTEPPTEDIVYDGGTPKKAYLLQDKCPGIKVVEGQLRDTPESIARVIVFLILPLLCIGGYGYLIARIIIYGSW